MGVTYPPELLPRPDEGQGAEIIVGGSLYWRSGLPIPDAEDFPGLRAPLSPADKARGDMPEIRFSEVDDT